MKTSTKTALTEAEFLALTVIADKMIGTALRMLEKEQDASHAARARYAQETEKHRAKASPVVQAVDANDADDADVLPFRTPNPLREAAPAPQEAPKRPVHPFAGDAERLMDAEVLEGTYAFEALMRTWVTNFEVEDAPQPDRHAAFLAAFTGYSAQVNAYIRSRGGLGGACVDTLARTGIVAPEDAARIGKRIAVNLVPIGTSMGIPLDGMLERSLYTRDLDNAPITGGPLKDSVDMTRPEFKP
jgi:hypothetical protein